MRQGLDMNRNSEQRKTSKTAKERSSSSSIDRTGMFHEKLKVHDGSQSRTAYDKNLVKQKVSEKGQKQSVGERMMQDDELVKHMSNLPGYLDRGENIGEKVLNFGVLNWELLEKWKCDQRYVPATGSANGSSTKSNSSRTSSSSSSTIPERVSHESSSSQRKKRSSLCPDINTSSNHLLQEGKPYQERMIYRKAYGTSPGGTSNGQEKMQPTSRSVEKKYSDLVLERGKGTDIKCDNGTGRGTSSLKLVGYKKLIDSKEKPSGLDAKTKKRVDNRQESENAGQTSTKPVTESCIGKDFEPSFPTEVGNPSLGFGVSLSSQVKTSHRDERSKKRVEVLHKSDIDSGPNLQVKEHENIILLLPKEPFRNSFSGAFDTKFAMENGKSFADDFSFLSEIPHSCPLSNRTDAKTMSDMKPLGLTDDAREMKIPSDAGINASTNGNSRRSDKETAKMVPTKGRSSSPFRRFSIGLGKMSRSHSFKELSVIPQLSSTHCSIKSGPASCEVSASSVNSNREQAVPTNRARSSPLRRLLDPLLKPKQPHVTALSLKANLNPFNSIQTGGDYLHQDEKHSGSTVRARLQFSEKNGLPLFKFVVDSNKSALMATAPNFFTVGKDDFTQHYTFYSVTEITKKNSGWMNQGSKGKGSSYAYNVIGQMKVSKIATAEDSSKQYVGRESVLFGDELRKDDQKIPKLRSNMELAAIVVKPASSKDNKLSEKMLVDGSSEVRCRYPSGTTVILSDAVHGWPNKGAPSPLLERWRSDGSCDCGGWDLGCKLSVLANQDPSCQNSCEESKARFSMDGFELFVQGRRTREKGPVFSLSPCQRGVYSVEFETSISLLQAFFISVNVLSCQRTSDLLERSKLPVPEAGLFHDSVPRGDGKMKASSISRGEVPPKYVSYPPHSPVSRV